MKKGTTIFLKLAVIVIGLIILALCVWAPTMAKEAAEMNPEYAYLRYPVLIGIYIPVIPFFIALYQAWKLLHYIEHKQAFSRWAVVALKRIKGCGIVIGCIYIAGMLFLITQHALHPGIALIGLLIVFASFVISVFSAVLQELLASALQIKKENELTI
ncbi:DUF2975 domain-containing protein [Sediminibacillus dalangtanensis]|uniref:DUF2975 domain-containing protein n=1 Tax=Sediminibacillus dalangtanensis TaxID=2729421 RepID=A0ABX7VVX6_9BACI|nr:DUF2975 domain-containing protein [Sediminibacillus dalangtanensis]QTN00699.1 DUF2975 domain-containing protein [Sediminibacillus dalangtanensis]